MAVRIAYVNLLKTDGAVLTASSQQSSMPVGNLLKSAASVRWRSNGPWTIRAGENDTIPFNRGGNKTATIAAGTYTTPVLMAAAVVAAMEAADATPVWASSYSSSKFTISGDLAFTLLFGTGTDVPKSVHPDLGFTSTDKASAVSHTAEDVSYQSRHVINVDLGILPFPTVSVARGHNVSSAGTMTFQGDGLTMVGVPLNQSGTSFVLSELLLGSDPRTAHFAAPIVDTRYLRLIIQDVQNPAGYNELGVWFVGVASTLTVDPSVQYAKENEHLSEVHFAEGGAHHQVVRARRRVYKLLFQLEQRAGLAVADRAIFDAIDALGIGASFFITFDAPSEPGLTVYGYNRVGLHEVYVQGTLWAIVMELAEALG